MTITPIEIATMAPKSQEASVFKHHESQRPMNEQAQISTQIHNQIQHNQQKAVKTGKSENEDYRYDAKEKGNNSYSAMNQKKKQGDKGNGKNKASTDTVRPGSIDIKI